MNYPVFDLHADTFSKALLAEKNHYYMSYLKLKHPDHHNFYEINAERIRNADVRLHTQSLFMMNEFMDKPFLHAMKILKRINDFVKEHHDFKLIKTFQDIDLLNSYGVLVSIEGLEVLENNLDLLDIFYEVGVRMIAPNWNRITPWLSPVTEKGGAFSKAADLASCLNNNKFIVDISHLSDKSVLDFSKLYQGTLIASHSNLRALNGAERNLSDELIDLIKERKGLIGINFYPEFLFTDVEKTKSKYSNFCFTDQVHYDYDYDYELNPKSCPISFLWILEILEYLDKKNALNLIAFGTDFDGIGSYAPGLENYSCLPRIQSFLKQVKCPDSVIEGLFFKNALNLLSNNL